ncbi:RHS repeat-associated core domain-containing protein [Chromobacterium haemolyticum]|nr:RHS repeat-associated core domain-containing protein [Chromobacterium haemolyticum]
MDYQAWGQAREIIADAANKAGIRNPFRFQGQYQDEESGLHYNRHRYYDPEIGRFISRDPIGLMGGINIHSYAPNPVEWVDPAGLAGYKIKANTAAPDTLSRGVHVNAHGPGLPDKGAHISLKPDGNKIAVVPAPGDKPTRDLKDSQWKNACKCVEEYLDDPKNVDRLAKAAQAGADMHKGSGRAGELSQVRDILNEHVRNGTNPMSKRK